MNEPRAPERAQSAMHGAARVVLWGLVFYAATLLAGAWLVKSKLGAAAVQAALAEWGAGRVGITWSDPDAALPAWTDLAKRAARGAALGFAAGALVIVFALVTRAATLSPNAPIVGQLFFGFVASALVAVRDELLLRGLVLRALRGAAPAVGLIACGVAAAAAAFGAGRTAPIELAIAGASGVVFALAWQHDRGAWLAVGAHAAWAWTTGSIVRGGLVDVRPAPGRWGGGDAGIEGSLATLVVAAAIVAGAVVWSRRRDRARV